tara:strand:- start:21622 stop:23727 length:2106 start_codon:yes stop_codon:yes gene_type:complete
VKTQKILFAPLRGIDDSYRPSQSPPKALRIRDMRYNQKDSWENSGGYKVLVPNDAEGDPAWNAFGEIESLHWFSQHGGNRQHMVFEGHNGTDMRLYVFDGSLSTTVKWRPLVKSDGSTADARTRIESPHLRTQSFAFGGRLYLFNGKDPALIFNGRYVEPAGFDGKPSAPTGQTLRKGATGIKELGLGRKPVSGSSAPDADDPIRDFGYRYKVTFINERGQESPPSDASSLITGENDINGKRKFVVVTMPKGGDTIVARRIYRTRQCLDTSGDMLSRAIGSNFYFLTEISNNAQTLFEDGIQDAFLGPLLDEDDFGTWPAAASMGAVFKNRVFLAGETSTDVRFSAVLRPEVFPKANILSFGQDECGQVTGLYASQNALLVFKQRGVFLIKSEDSNDGSFFSAQNISRDIGCIAPNSIAEVPGVGVFFLAQDGVYAIQGSLESGQGNLRIIRYSSPISNLTGRINNAAAIQACGTYYPQDKEYWLAVAVDGSEKNNFVLVYHGNIGSWSFRENFPIADAVVSQDHRGYYLFGSNDSNNKGVHAYTRGAGTKGSNASTSKIEPLWETTDLDFNGPFAAFSPKYVVCDVIGYGDNDFELSYRINRNITFVESAKSVDQQDLTNVYSVYNTATWSTSSQWYEHRPIPIRFDITTLGQPACRELRLTFESSGRRMQVLSFQIGVVAGAPYEKVVPVSSVVEEQRG